MIPYERLPSPEDKYDAGNERQFRAMLDRILRRLVSLATTAEVVLDYYTKLAMDALLALKSNIASPVFTGIPAAPTAAPGTNTTQLATTAFDTAAVLVETNARVAADALKSNIASPVFTGIPAAPTAAPGTNTTQLATTAFDTAAVLVETNARVAADALKSNIASPVFTGTVTSGGSIALGVNPASTGILSLPNNAFIRGRNAANSADIDLLAFYSDNSVFVGGAGVSWVGLFNGTNIVQLTSSGQLLPVGFGTPGLQDIGAASSFGRWRDLHLLGDAHIKGLLYAWPAAHAAGVLANDGSGTLTWAAGGGGAVSSVFGRSGAVVAAGSDYSFAQLASTPTTLAGYGITDFNSLGDARWLTLSGGTLTGQLITPAATTALASLRAPHGAAPTSPVNGDIWTTTAGVFARINAVTSQLAALAGPTFSGTVTSGGALDVTGILTLTTSLVMSNNTAFKMKTAAGVANNVVTMTSSDNLQFGSGTLQANIQIFCGTTETVSFYKSDSATLVARVNATAKQLDSWRFSGVLGTVHVAGDYVLSAGWGATRTVSAVVARDCGGRVTVLPAGSGIAASPTVILTFKDGTYTNAPAIVVCRGDAAAPTTGVWVVSAVTATAATFRFVGTPVSGTSYILQFIVIGK